jgi:hypothetical protein
MVFANYLIINISVVLQPYRPYRQIRQQTNTFLNVGEYK